MERDFFEIRRFVRGHTGCSESDALRLFGMGLGGGSRVNPTCPRFLPRREREEACRRASRRTPRDRAVSGWCRTRIEACALIFRTRASAAALRRRRGGELSGVPRERYKNVKVPCAECLGGRAHPCRWGKPLQDSIAHRSNFSADAVSRPARMGCTGSHQGKKHAPLWGMSNCARGAGHITRTAK